MKCITRIPAISLVCLSSYLIQFANFICKDLLHLFEVLLLHARATWVREFNYPLKNESHILGNEIWKQLSIYLCICTLFPLGLHAYKAWVTQGFGVSQSLTELSIGLVKLLHCQKVSPAEQTVSMFCHSAAKMRFFSFVLFSGLLSCHTDYNLPSLARSQSFCVASGGRALGERKSSNSWLSKSSHCGCPEP